MRRREGESVQKIHTLTNNIAIGFAGNIDTALRMIGDASRYIGSPAGMMPEQPSRYLFAWARRARWIWHNHLGDRERSSGVAFMWMGALPTQAPGIVGVTMAWIVRSPDFEPVRIPTRSAWSIGSGAHIEQYVDELYALEDNFPNIIQFEAGPWVQLLGAALPIFVSISDVIERHMQPGISPHLVICSVQWGRVDFTTNDREALTPGAPSRQMPPIAQTWARSGRPSSRNTGSLRCSGWGSRYLGRATSRPPRALSHYPARSSVQAEAVTSQMAEWGARRPRAGSPSTRAPRRRPSTHAAEYVTNGSYTSQSGRCDLRCGRTSVSRAVAAPSRRATTRFGAVSSPEATRARIARSRSAAARTSAFLTPRS